MILAIDIGNTNIVAGAIEKDKVLFIERIVTDEKKTELELFVLIKTIFELYGVDDEKIDGAIISSVVPPLTGTLKKAMEKLTEKKVMLVEPGIKTGLNILTDNPAQVGADLIVNAVAGLKYYGAPLIMIDMGTATTLSVLDKNSNYIGGVISPGAGISLDALVSKTAQLPKIGLNAPKRVVGKNTVDSMESGVIFAQASMLDGMIERVEEELGYQMTVVATGGYASNIVRFCKKRVIYDNELTLKGLGIIYEKNV